MERSEIAARDVDVEMVSDDDHKIKQNVARLEFYSQVRLPTGLVQ